VGLALARETAADEGVRVTTVVSDLERDPLPDGEFDMIACFHYRQRTLFPAIREKLAKGGIVLVELATVRNLEHHERPPRQWRAEPNELLRDLSGLTVIYYREGFIDDHAVAQMIARRE
jgi:hypothetical protein